MSVRTLTAVEWICDTCHDTGLARTLPDAAEALGEHMEDYHAPIDPEPLDDDDAVTLDADRFIANNRYAWGRTGE